MELTLNVYKLKANNKYIICKEPARVATAQDFELTTGVCEDIMNLINIDMFEGGLDALSDESKKDLVIGIIKDGYPMFKEIIKEVFELTDDEAKHLKIADVAGVVIDIVKYSFIQLGKTFADKKSKN